MSLFPSNAISYSTFTPTDSALINFVYINPDKVELLLQLNTFEYLFSYISLSQYFF